MKPKWRDQSWNNHERFIARGNRKNRLTDEAEVINFLAQALCGETGELANLIKKMWRGDSVPTDGLRNELPDIRIDLEHLSQHLGFDLDRACQEKVQEVTQRLDAMDKREAA